MTAEDLLALADDGAGPEANPGRTSGDGDDPAGLKHSTVEFNPSTRLGISLKSQPLPRGLALSGEADFRIRRNPDTMVGIEIAYISAELAESLSDDVRFVEGVPI